VLFNIGIVGWTASGTGTATLLDNGATGHPQMQYDANGTSFSGAWQLSTTAATTGIVNLDYFWSGFHSFFLATAGVDVFVSRNGVDVSVVNLVNEGPQTCPPCFPPSAGFLYTGSTSVSVQAGDQYGFRLRGSHSDIANTLQGIFKVSINSAPLIAFATPSPIGSDALWGQMLVLRGGGLPATSGAGVLYNQGGPDIPSNFAFTAQPNVVIARTPTGLAPGPATVRLTNGVTSVGPFSITISPTPGAPILRAVQGSCSGAPITGVTAGQQIFVLADGVDTSQTTFVWTIEGGGASAQAATDFTSGGTGGAVCTATTVPATLTVGSWALQAKTLVGASFSPLSNGFFLVVH